VNGDVRPTSTVLFVESGETGGGSFESLYQHLRIIDRSRFRPVVVCLNDLPSVIHIRDLGIPVHVLTDPLFSRHASIKRKWLLRKLRRGVIRINRIAPWLLPRVLQFIHRPTIAALRNLARAEHATLIHLNINPFRDFFGVIAAQQAGIPCVSHLRSADPIAKGQFNSLMVRYTNAVVQAYIANSEMTRDYWLEVGLSSDKMNVVLNGIEGTTIERADVRQRWGLQPDAVVVGVVTPLRSSLKIDEFTIKAFAKYLTHNPQAVLLIVGDGPMREILTQEAARLGISEKVIFAGFQSDAKQILAGMDASLILNNHNPFSRVAIESLQVGTPLVATDIGGIREILEDRVNGMLVPYGDTGAFVKALERIVSDQLFRDELVKNGQRTVRERLSVESYAAQVSAISLEVMSHKQPPEDLG
jgi:glycosyltransferase involved in cell wall biosynthesis